MTDAALSPELVEGVSWLNALSTGAHDSIHDYAPHLSDFFFWKNSEKGGRDFRAADPRDVLVAPPTVGRRDQIQDYSEMKEVDVKYSLANTCDCLPFD
jgi:hypothetical protein